MSSRSAWLKDDILSQIGEQIKALQLGQQNAEADGNPDYQVTSKNIHLQCLLDLLDHVLLHGLQNVELGYWPFVCHFTHSETTRVITQHPQVTNDLDKGRVWVYTAFSEGLLESYFRMFVETPKVAKKFYNKQAFVRDKERLIVLETLVSGLDFINIVLEQNCPYLGYGSLSEDKAESTKLPTTNHAPMTISSANLRKGSSSTASSYSNSSTITGYFSPNSAATSECGSTDTLLESGDDGDSKKASEQSLVEKSEGHYGKQQRDKSMARSQGDSTSIGDNSRRTSQSEDSDNVGVTDGEGWSLTLVQSQFPKEHSTPLSDQTCTPHHHPEEFPRFFTEKDWDGNDSAAGEIVFGRKPKKKRPSSKKRNLPETECEQNGRNEDVEGTDGKTCDSSDRVDGSEDKKDKADQTHIPAPQNAPAPSDAFPSGSTDSLSGSLASTDSLDQFCRDFDSSVNTTASDSSMDTTANTTTVQICCPDDADKTLEDDRLFKELDPRFRTYSNESCGSFKGSPMRKAFKRERSQYEGIILGLPKRPTVDEADGCSCDVRLDQNTILIFSLEVFQKNGEQFQRMVRVTTGHEHGHLRPAYVTLTDAAIYILRKVPTADGRNLKLETAVPYTTLKKIDIGLDHQLLTIVSKSAKCCLSIADSAVCRNFLLSLRSLLELSMQRKQVDSIFSLSTTEQEAAVVTWLQDDVNMQISGGIVSFSLVHWYGVAGPDASIEVLRFQSVKEGYLEIKQQQLLGAKWTHAFFVLTNGNLCQYTQPEDKTATLTVDLRGARGGGCLRVQDPDRPYAFQLISSAGSPLLTLAAASESEASDWMYKVCQWIAETFDSNEDRGCTVVSRVPCCLAVTRERVVLCFGDPSEGNFRLLSSCSVENITRIYVDNEVRNYCLLKFEPNEVKVTEGSWFLRFRSEFELGKFESAVAECWKELFQVDLQFLVVGEGRTREKAREQSRRIEEFYNDQSIHRI